MSYEKKISKAEPGLNLLVLDDSGSIAENLAGTNDQKYKWVERYFGIILKDMLTKSTVMQGQNPSH